MGEACPEAAPASWSSVRLPYDPWTETAPYVAPPAVCRCLDGHVAWIGAFEHHPTTEGADAVIWRTVDHGTTWSPARLGRGEPVYTTWAGGPGMDLTVRSKTSLELRVIDEPQHHNGHRMTEAWFRSHDGGVTWRHVQTRSTCLDRASHCQGG